METDSPFQDKNGGPLFLYKIVDHTGRSLLITSPRRIDKQDFVYVCHMVTESRDGVVCQLRDELEAHGYPNLNIVEATELNYAQALGMDVYGSNI